MQWNTTSLDNLYICNHDWMEYLYHVTTERKAKMYRDTWHIYSPVRWFDTLQWAMARSIKIWRKVIYKVKCGGNVYKLPDHHNMYWTAYWNEGDVTDFECVFSADKDA